MSITMNTAAVFDPQLSASLQNDICRRGWEGLATGLPFEESTTTWWDTYGLECNATVASRLAPQLIEFLRQARTIRPDLSDQVGGNFFYYLSGLSTPESFFLDWITIDPEEPDADRYVILYHATLLMSHPVGLVFVAPGNIYLHEAELISWVMQSLTMDDTIIEPSQRPWVPLQDIFAAYLDMLDIGKIAIEDPRANLDYMALDRAAIIAGTWRPKVWPFQRPWLLKPHSQAILDRSVTALGELLNAIEKRMPPRPLGIPVAGRAMGMTSIAEKLVSTNQASEDSFIIRFLRRVNGLLASARPDLLFIAPGLHVPNQDAAMQQPFEGVDDQRQNPPILLFRGELSDGTAALTTFPGRTWNPFTRPYKERITAFLSGLWISEHDMENPHYDDACRLLLPDRVLVGGRTRQHHAKSTDGFLLEQQPGLEWCEGLSAGLYQTSCNVFVGRRHEVQLFRVLEHWVQRVEDGTWTVDEHGVAGGMEKWAEADESETMAEKYRLPYTW